MSSDMTCPFCAEPDFDELGLAYHLAVYCAAYAFALKEFYAEREQRYAKETHNA